MSYFDDASLVMIPSGYKTSKVYSVKPTDGSGDLAFTRSNDTATRVGPDGLIEKVRTNIALYSEQFNNAAWTALQATVSANATTSPIGTTTADKVIPTAVLSFHNVTNSPFLSNGVSYSMSVYAKADGYSSLFVGNGFGTLQALFNLTTGVVTSVTAGTTASIVSAGNGWFRCSISFVASNVTNQLQITIDNGSGLAFVGNGTSGIFLWGAQIETGDIVTDYIATTTAAVSVGPVANVPRLDYLNSTCPKLLLEPQRSNVCPFSEQFNNAAWTKFQATITPNAIAAPDGTTSADLILDNAVSDQHAVYEGISSGAGVHTWSVFAKAQNLNFIIVNAFGGSDNRTWFNLSNGTIGTNAAGNTATITNYGNGWYRCTVTRSYASGTFLLVAGTAPSDGVFSYVGSGNGLYLWGAQVELGAYATSYIPTLGAAVTRGADTCSKTGISSLIGQTQGTIFYDGFFGNEINELYVFLQKESSSGVDDSIYIQQSSGAIALNVYSGATQQTFIIGSSPTLGQRIKIAAGYKANDFVLYVNGVQIGTDNSGAVPTCGALQLGSYRATPTAANFIATKGINQTILFPTRLSNADLAALTA